MTRSTICRSAYDVPVLADESDPGREDDVPDAGGPPGVDTGGRPAHLSDAVAAELRAILRLSPGQVRQIRDRTPTRRRPLRLDGPTAEYE